MAEASEFLDQAVLISGAGRGIGKRLALAFAAEGARIGLLARSRAELDLAQLEISHMGGQALALLCDVRDYAQVEAALERFRAFAGPVRILICAHGAFGWIGPLAACQPQAWMDGIATNLGGAMHLCRAVLPDMLEARAGKIVLLAGPGAASPRRNFSSYSAAQAALARLAETLAEEVREANIQVNCMNPGPTYTSMTDDIIAAGERAGAEELEAALRLQSSGGATPEEQIELARFLCSSRSNHLSGMLISVSDKWRKLEHSRSQGAMFTLRRILHSS
ncbi:MAG: SDR family oxidoreductase [Bryobacteraceae bacterium]|nr:SDR family oxidoreductase [Bryobacteraceae bacterium]